MSIDSISNVFRARFLFESGAVLMCAFSLTRLC